MRAVLEDFAAANRLGPETPGFSCLAVRGGETVFSFNIGSRDTAGNPLTPHSNFRIASITKQFTAACILRLMEEGKLSLTTTLCDIFPDFPAYGRDIQICHLLSHRSGLRDYGLSLDDIQTPQVSDDQVLMLAQREKETLFAPGSRYDYSNGAYCLLAKIVEKTSGITFGEYLRQYILAPAGMTAARLGTKEDIPERVYGFERDAAQHWYLKDQRKTSSTEGDGGLYASADALALWFKALYQDRRILSAASVNLMTQPYIASESPGESAGFGIFIATFAGELCYWHSGSSAGFRHAAFYFPARKTSFTILSNLGPLDIPALGKKAIGEDFDF